MCSLKARAIVEGWARRIAVKAVASPLAAFMGVVLLVDALPLLVAMAGVGSRLSPYSPPRPATPASCFTLTWLVLSRVAGDVGSVLGHLCPTAPWAGLWMQLSLAPSTRQLARASAYLT